MSKDDTVIGSSYNYSQEAIVQKAIVQEAIVQDAIVRGDRWY